MTQQLYLPLLLLLKTRLYLLIYYATFIIFIIRTQRERERKSTCKVNFFREKHKANIENRKWARYRIQ